LDPRAFWVSDAADETHAFGRLLISQKPSTAGSHQDQTVVGGVPTGCFGQIDPDGIGSADTFRDAVCDAASVTST